MTLSSRHSILGKKMNQCKSQRQQMNASNLGFLCTFEQ